MRHYTVEIRWDFKGRYPKAEQHRVHAATIRAAIGKALAVKRTGWREASGQTLRVTATVLGNGMDTGKVDTGKAERKFMGCVCGKDSGCKCGE